MNNRLPEGGYYSHFRVALTHFKIKTNTNNPVLEMRNIQG